ncbi:MAG: PEP-CTERM sorting domain-containing protein [Planctomycetota bacterium]
MPARHSIPAYVVCAGVVCALAVPATADWDPGDGHKMHWPQLPDFNGWDVAATTTGEAPNKVYRHVADDWQCKETGPVDDIHFWGSWKNGVKGTIDHFMVSVWADDPAGPGGYFDDNPFSTPLYRDEDGTIGDIWYWGVYPGEFTERLYGQGQQGWYDPNTGQAIQDDHTEIYQYNISCPNAFVQEKGTIYWLEIAAVTTGGEWGWKTSGSEQFMDDATYYDSLTTVPDGYPHAGWDMPDWQELYGPMNPENSLDMAFVITPEPSAMGLLALGGLALMHHRRKSDTASHALFEKEKGVQ